MNSDMVAPALRLAPEMASLRLLALTFVRAYMARWGASPSYGEIAEALRTNRTRVKMAVRSLVRDGLLLRTPGVRGLSLPDRRDEALRILLGLGWTIDDQGLRLNPPEAVTNPTLQPIAVLDYHPDQD